MPIDFSHILAWQKGHAFVLAVYEKCRKLPEYERHGLYSQFTRAAVSITANIAEGVQKVSKADKLRFLNISQGSLAECLNYIILCKDLNYFTQQDTEELNYLIGKASFFLNKYYDAIDKDSGIKEDITPNIN